MKEKKNEMFIRSYPSHSMWRCCSVIIRHFDLPFFISWLGCCFAFAFANCHQRSQWSSISIHVHLRSKVEEKKLFFFSIFFICSHIFVVVRNFYIYTQNKMLNKKSTTTNKITIKCDWEMVFHSKDELRNSVSTEWIAESCECVWSGLDMFYYVITINKKQFIGSMLRWLTTSTSEIKLNTKYIKTNA